LKNTVPLVVSEVRREVADELGGGFSLGLGNGHNVQANKAKWLRCYANVVSLMRGVEIEVWEG
jgi:hypothetical protein